MAAIAEMLEKANEEGFLDENAEAKVCQDIVLKALSESSLSRNATIKGGVVMRSITKDARRATQDMDIDFIRYSLGDEAIREFIRKRSATMKEITDQEWRVYVTQCTTGEWPVPPSFVSDKNNWVCRAIVGRVLYFIKDVEGALTVLSTFINDVKPDLEDHPDQGMCEAEHFVLSLRDISEIIWKLTKNGDAALQYLDRAFKICREFPYRFHTEARGDIWYRRLNILAESDRLEQAAAEAEALVKAEKQESHTPKPIIPDPLYDAVNPYIFYSLRFLAEQKRKEGKTAEACALFAEAYDYFPLSEAGVRDVAKAKATTDIEEQYKAWLFCTTLQYLPWEKQPIVKLRD